MRKVNRLDASFCKCRATLASRLKVLLVNRKQSYYSAAKEMTMGTTTLKSYVDADRNPSLSNVVELCLYFDVSPNYLLGYDKWCGDGAGGGRSGDGR